MFARERQTSAKRKYTALIRTAAAATTTIIKIKTTISTITGKATAILFLPVCYTSQAVYEPREQGENVLKQGQQ